MVSGCAGISLFLFSGEGKRKLSVVSWLKNKGCCGIAASDVPLIGLYLLPKVAEEHCLTK